MNDKAMTQEINKAFHEALGKKDWHELRENPAYLFDERAPASLCSCGKTVNDFADWKHDNPDYCSDARLVIEAMRERNEDTEFIWFAVAVYPHNLKYKECAITDLIMDKTGKLAVLAYEWLNHNNDEYERWKLRNYPGSRNG